MVSKRLLTYSKSSGTRELSEGKEVRKPLPVEVMATTSLPSVRVPSGYRKDDGVLSFGLFCVISGGTVRERTFLQEVSKKHTFKGLEVIFVTSKWNQGGLTPRMMCEAYANISKDGVLRLSDRNVLLESVDKIYIFTDVDHYEEELHEILSNHKHDDLPRWIISNPDFEIWLYYCFRNDPNSELVDVLKVVPSQRSTKLKEVNGTFNKGGGLDTRKAFEHLKDGITHSKEHYLQDEYGVPLLFSTQMHRFAEDVLAELGNEYDEWMKRKQEFRASKKSCHWVMQTKCR